MFELMLQRFEQMLDSKPDHLGGKCEFPHIQLHGIVIFKKHFSTCWLIPRALLVLKPQKFDGCLQAMLHFCQTFPSKTTYM